MTDDETPMNEEYTSDKEIVHINDSLVSNCFVPCEKFI